MFFSSTSAEQVCENFDELQGVALLNVEREIIRLDLVERYQFVDKFLHLVGILESCFQMTLLRFVQFIFMDTFKRCND